MLSPINSYVTKANKKTAFHKTPHTATANSKAKPDTAETSDKLSDQP